MALSKHPNVLRVRGEWVDAKGRLHIACRQFDRPPNLLDLVRILIKIADLFEQASWRPDR